ncbi:hypothetical protein [Streptomyces sp. NBC_00338]|uniref:hypothetical protein n=1 Tax=Streptomyces sp. NBC_00338 TaxID=2975715 RepID=UPI002257FBED|nr:hypothetical protein [Streptomyces sp. NBC_00338]MCX5141176.1 hypothetical protein [Streptomyces sp. NBC_00338]
MNTPLPLPPLVDGVALDLAPHRNNAGCLARSLIVAEGLDGFGRAFSTSGLDAAATALGLPAQWGEGEPDNVACEGQTVDVGAPERVTAVRVAGVASGGTTAGVFRLHGDDGTVTPVRLRLADFLSRQPAEDSTLFAEADFLYDIGGRTQRKAQPRIWLATARLSEPASCTRLELPVNPDLHLFGIWLTPDGS